MTLKGVISSAIEVASSVPEGPVQGPLLFLVHIADISNVVIVSSRMKYFADDTRVLCEKTDVNSTEHLWDDLQVTFVWAWENNEF